MPAQDRATRSGFNSLTITDYYLSVLAHLKRLKSAKQTAEELQTTRWAVAGIVRAVERKVGSRLFERSQGRWHEEWTPINPDGWKRLESWLFVNRRGAK